MRRAFTLIEMMIVIAIIAIIAAIAIPNLLEARKHGDEASAIGSLKTINASQAIYLERGASGTYGDLGDLQADGYIDDVLGGGAKQGYNIGIRIDVKLNPASSFLPITPPGQYEYFAYAFAAVPGQTGNRTFVTNQSGVIRFSDGTKTVFPSNLHFASDFKPIGGK